MRYYSNLQNFYDFRDDFIIKIGTEAYEHVDHKYVEDLPRYHRPYEEQRVYFPVILFNIFKEEGSFPNYFIDPMEDNYVLTIKEYLKYWTNFVNLIITEDQEKGQQYWASTIAQYDALHGPKKALNFLERLWQHRWINSATYCGHLRVFLKNKIISSLNDDAVREYWISEAFKLKKDIKQAKEMAVDLDEWFESFFLLFPRVLEIKTKMTDLGNQESAKYGRYFEEVRADISTTLAMVFVICKDGHKHPFSMQYLPLSYNELKDPNDFDKAIKDIKLELLHNYKGRTILPKFWYDEAMKNLTTKRDKLAFNLDHYSERAYHAMRYFTRFSI